MNNLLAKLIDAYHSKTWFRVVMNSISLGLIALISLILSLSLPLSEEAAGFFRHGFNSWLLILWGVFFLIFWISAVTGRIIRTMVTISLFTLPLTALWRVGYAEMQIIGGTLSFSDSAQYYHEASRLLEGFAMTAFGVRHPFAPAFLAALLGMSGNNLMWSLAALVFLNGFSILISAEVLRKYFNPLVASGFVVLSFLFYRRFIGMTDTENLGFLLGNLGFSLLFIGALTKFVPFIFTGTFITAFALNTRPGAFIILPLLVTWFLIYFGRLQQKRNLKKFVVFAAMILVPFLLNAMLATALGENQGTLFSNYAYTLYGIADGGTGWEQVYQDYPEITALEDREAAEFVYQLAYQKMFTQPVLFLNGIRSAYRDFFSLSQRSAFGFVSGGDVTAFDFPQPENALTYQVARGVLWLLTPFGLIFLWQNRTRPESGLIFAGLLGIILSVAFIPPQDAAVMRVYAASMPYLIILPMLGLVWLVSRRAITRNNQEFITHEGYQATATALFLVTITIIGSLAIRILRQPLSYREISCQAGQYSAVLRIRNGSYLQLTRDETIKQTGIPELRYRDFVDNLQDFPNAAQINELAGLIPPRAIMNAVNLQNGQMLWAVLPSEALTTIPLPIKVCGSWLPQLLENGLGFLNVESYSVIESSE